MKTNKAVIFSLLAMTSVISGTAFGKSVSVDPAQSQVRWTGKKVTGAHNGTIALKSGQLEVDGKNLKGGKFDIDMTSIVVEDIKDPEYNAKLAGHLKSDDFFGVDKHPVSTLAITSVKPIKKGEYTHELAGNLTIKGQTHPVSFPVKAEVAGDKATAKGKIKVDRTKYGIRYGSGKFFENLGDKMIDDTFELDVNVQAKL